MQTADVLDRFYAAYNAHNPVAAALLYVSDGTHAEASPKRGRRGRQAIAEGLEGLMAAFPDARWSVRRRIVAGSQAAVHYVLTGTLGKPLGPYEARGQRLALEGVHLFTFGPEGIVETRDFWDGSAFHRQMSRDNGG
jgi:hypothetical protein